MKFFIRKRNEGLKPGKIFGLKAIGSAFLAMSALAVFCSAGLKVQDNPVKPQGSKVKGAVEVKDSVFDARSVFEKIETSALEILPVQTRLDMLDYWDNDSVYKASNAMDGLSWLDKVSADYLKVHITSVSSYEIKLLPGKKDTKLVMTIYTVGDDVQAQDSEIKFYDADLSELPTANYLVMPQVKDFFEIPKGSATKMKEIEAMIPFPTMAFSADPENDNLEARLTVEQYINQDDWNIAKLFLKPSLILHWKNFRYKP